MRVCKQPTKALGAWLSLQKLTTFSATLLTDIELLTYSDRLDIIQSVSACPGVRQDVPRHDDVGLVSSS